MTIQKPSWTPHLEGRSGPKYKAIADALADDIASGKLTEGAKLPPQRELSWELNVTVGTITRAYQDAERRGLVAGEVGRGTFVQATSDGTAGRRGISTQLPLMPVYPEDDPADGINLKLNYPPPGLEVGATQRALGEIMQSPDLPALISYQPNAGMQRHRKVAAQWMQRRLPNARADKTLLTSGGQHGIFVGLSAVTQPGDTVVTESLSYGGLKSIARNLGLVVQGLPIDEKGLIPDAFEEYCRNHRPTALYTVCTPNNPSNTVLSEKRRRAIASIAARYDVFIVEDDIFAMLMDDAPMPITHYAPEHAILVTSAAKYLTPGLRIGVATGPRRMIPAMEAAIRATCGLASPITAEVFARWVADGTAEDILNTHKQEIAARHSLFRDYFDPLEADYALPNGAMHAWLQIPAPQMAADFIMSAERRGVKLGSSGAFVINRAAAPQAVRICLCTPRKRETLAYALESLAALYQEGNAGTDIAIY